LAPLLRQPRPMVKPRRWCWKIAARRLRSCAPWCRCSWPPPSPRRSPRTGRPRTAPGSWCRRATRCRGRGGGHHRGHVRVHHRKESR